MKKLPIIIPTGSKEKKALEWSMIDYDRKPSHGNLNKLVEKCLDFCEKVMT